jgi:CHAT domain-containing protein
MGHFYTNLWVVRLGKADALWAAKNTMRENREALMNWAGWVLTGDPD